MQDSLGQGKLPSLPSLPYCNSLRHLIIKTDRMERVVAQLPQFKFLRTLSLEYVGWHQELHMALDVTAVTMLEDLAIENFSVDSITGPSGCKLHTCLYCVGGYGRGCVDTEPWIFSSMWSSKNIPLSSFSLRNVDFSEESQEALDLEHRRAA